MGCAAARRGSSRGARPAAEPEDRGLGVRELRELGLAVAFHVLRRRVDEDRRVGRARGARQEVERDFRVRDDVRVAEGHEGRDVARVEVAALEEVHGHGERVRGDAVLLRLRERAVLLPRRLQRRVRGRVRVGGGHVAEGAGGEEVARGLGLVEDAALPVLLALRVDAGHGAGGVAERRGERRGGAAAGRRLLGAQRGDEVAHGHVAK